MENEIIKLRKQGKTYNEIRNTLGCSKSTISYHCRKNNLSNPNEQRKPSNDDIKNFNDLYLIHKNCRIVAELTGWSRPCVSKYVKHKYRLSDEEKKQNRIKSVINWRRRTKEKLVKYKGGKCIKCGYNKCLEALEFHHRNPNEKEFSISKYGNTRAIDKLYKEVDKCDLVCSNCHKEIHYKLKYENYEK